MGDEEPTLVANKGICTNCNEEVWSKHRRHYVTCGCGQLSLDGGNGGFGWTRGKYKDSSVWSDAPFEIIRKHELRGGRGVDGRQPLTWVPICDMSDSWLAATVVYMKERKQAYGRHYNNLLKEVEYREENNIVVDGD